MLLSYIEILIHDDTVFYDRQNNFNLSLSQKHTIYIFKIYKISVRDRELRYHLLVMEDVWTNEHI